MENTFKWPGSNVIEEVDCKFVFYWDFTIIPKKRVWIVEDEDWMMLEMVVATTAETSRACSSGSKIIMAICSFSVSIIFVTNERRN